MKQQQPQNPLSEIIDAIYEIDRSMQHLEFLENDLVMAKSRLTDAKKVLQQTFIPACIEAQHIQSEFEIPRNYQQGNTLIRIDETTQEVHVERLQLGNTYVLKRLLENKQEVSS